MFAAAGAVTAQMQNPMGGMGTYDQQQHPPSAPMFDVQEEYRKGREALKAHRYKEAISAFDRVLEVARRDSNTWALLGVSKEGAGDLEGAREAYEKAVRYKPDSIVAHRLLGVVEARLGHAAKAQAQLDWLQKRAGACGSCSSAADLKAAIAAVQAAMAPPPAPAPAPSSPPPSH